MGRWNIFARCPVTAGGESFQLVVLTLGNPQCVLLGPLPGEERFRRLGAALERHEMFPSGQRRVCRRRSAGPRPHPDLGTRRRPDVFVRHRVVRGPRRGGRLWRRGARRRGRGAWRSAAGRVARRRRLSDRVGRSDCEGEWLRTGAGRCNVVTLFQAVSSRYLNPRSVVGSIAG